MEMMIWEYTGLKGVVELLITHQIGMLIKYPLCIYILFRDNCFGLSVEDSRDCCRQCMMIRRTKTNRLNES